MLKSTVQSAKAKVDDQVKEKRAHMRRQELEAKQKHDEMLQRARQRGYLVDNYNSGTHRSNLAKAQTLKNMLSIMKDAGLTDKQAEARLSLEDKEILEEEKFIEAQKKRYGKTTKE